MAPNAATDSLLSLFRVPLQCAQGGSNRTAPRRRTLLERPQVVPNGELPNLASHPCAASQENRKRAPAAIRAVVTSSMIEEKFGNERRVMPEPPVETVGMRSVPKTS